MNAHASDKTRILALAAAESTSIVAEAPHRDARGQLASDQAADEGDHQHQPDDVGDKSRHDQEHCADDDQEAVEQRLQVLITDSAHNVVLVATVGILVAGVVAGTLVPMLQHELPLGRITALAVDEDQRGLGIGKRLVAAAERWFADRAITRLELTSAEQRG